MSSGDQGNSTVKKKFITTIIVESSYHPDEENIGPISLMMDASAGGSSAKIVQCSTKEEIDPNNQYAVLNNSHRKPSNEGGNNVPS